MRAVSRCQPRDEAEHRLVSARVGTGVSLSSRYVPEQVLRAVNAQQVVVYDSFDLIDPTFRTRINSVLYGRRFDGLRWAAAGRFHVRSGRICHATRRFV